jgi:lipopolysaccharide transport system ATP-binding protein
MSTVISVENLSKTYRLGQIGTGTLSHDLNVWWAKVRGKPNPLLKIGQADHGNRDGEEIWALRDISFSVEQGEVLGIIGRNGAGKSTLLKILSRVTAPTSGKIKIKGRVASLLEVGTGFHPELTGRENITLNGAILGMSRKEIDRKFDEIVDFSGVEKFIDTPVKRYSSGMYVRLAFAVAAHLDPEILVVDEVLAVGDAAFQKKCLGKMGRVAQEGRTVLFVSHNMNAIHELCIRVILVEAGQIAFAGSTREVISHYLSTGEILSVVNLDDLEHDRPQQYVRLRHLALMDKNYHPSTSFIMGDAMVARIGLECNHPMKNAEVGLKISSQQGVAIHYLTSSWEGMKIDLEPGPYTFEVCLPRVLLFPGKYQVSLWANQPGEYSDDAVQGATFFEVLKGDITGHPTTVEKYAYSGCEVYAPSEWKLLTNKAKGKS